ncbi:MAG: hypothetical protein WCJ02_07270 [bacterium]
MHFLKGFTGLDALPIAPFAAFSGDKSTASWLVNAVLTADWQAFQRDGKLNSLPSTK